MIPVLIEELGIVTSWRGLHCAICTAYSMSAHTAAAEPAHATGTRHLCALVLPIALKEFCCLQQQCYREAGKSDRI